MDMSYEYGPLDYSVLTLQSMHRSEDVIRGHVDNLLHASRVDGYFWRMVEENPPHWRVQLLLHEMGFYGVFRCGPLSYDFHLITALVERWRPETNTFHFWVGEVTVTLQDVAVIWGLPIDGIPLICVDPQCQTREWQGYCQEYLGFSPKKHQLRAGRLLVTALATHMRRNPITDASPTEHVAQYARACALMLLGCVMCPNSSGKTVPLLYLQKMENLEEVGTFSWGSAVLAYLYRELSTACQRGKHKIGGPLQLLQIWAWSRITPLMPELNEPRIPMEAIIIHDNIILPIPPYGGRWSTIHSYTRTAPRSVRIIREFLDHMLSHHFIWQPYDMTAPEITAYVDGSTQLWTTRCPLINYARVEMHHPDRVLRQFGMVQDIPEMPEFRESDLHKRNRGRHVGEAWSRTRQQYIQMWMTRLQYSVNTERISDEFDTDDWYYEWYDRITRIRISPISIIIYQENLYHDYVLANTLMDLMSVMVIIAKSKLTDSKDRESVVDECVAISTDAMHIWRYIQARLARRPVSNQQTLRSQDRQSREQADYQADSSTDYESVVNECVAISRDAKHIWRCIRALRPVLSNQQLIPSQDRLSTEQADYESDSTTDYESDFSTDYESDSSTHS